MLQTLRRRGLFILTNITIIVMISVVLRVLEAYFGIQISGNGYTGLLIFAFIFGFAGALFNLMISRRLAKRAYKITLLDEISSQQDAKLSIVRNTVARIATEEGITMPEVGYYESATPNAFATGPSKNKSLVAVSTGLLGSMSEQQVAAVIGHEMAHVMNGDMITMTLLQGLMNTFVIFFSRIAAQAIATASRDEGKGLGHFSYYLLVIAFDIIFGLLASLILMWYSRRREYRADAGGARYVGTEHMIGALRALDKYSHTKTKQDGFALMKISGGKVWMNMLRSHPPITKRIEALQNLQYVS